MASHRVQGPTVEMSTVLYGGPTRCELHQHAPLITGLEHSSAAVF
jgi:hypothetical protein